MSITLDALGRPVFGPGGSILRPGSGGGGGARALLTASRISVGGFYRVPNGIADMYYSGYNIAIRRVGAETRMFTWSHDNWDGLGRKLLEFVIPDGTAPNATIGSAPRMTYVRNWGNIWSGRDITGGSGSTIGSLLWDEARHGLWWTYGDGYVPVTHHPTIGFTHINDGTTTATSYGPWRQEWGSNLTRGGLFQVPSAFADAYTGGNRLAVMAGMASGRAGCPYGPNGSVLDTIDPFTQAADVAVPPFGGQHTIGNQGLLLHTDSTPAARDTRYKICSWDSDGPPRYDCRLGHTISPGPALWGGIGVATGVAVEDDTTASAVWVDTGTHHGLVFFGQLATTPIGYTAPGDPDGYVHCGYGDPEHATKTGSSGSGYVNNSCCHGQPDPWWGATGPYCHYRVPHSWIYDPADLIATAQGSAALHSRTPTETIQWTNPSDGSLSWPSIAQFNTAGWVAGSCWDPITSRIYVVLRNQDSTTHWTTSKQPVLLALNVS